MKVLFTGSRWWKDEKAIRKVLGSLDKSTLIIEGGAKGLDDMVHRLAKEMGFVHFARFPARWGKYKDSAGPRRNQVMLDVSQPDICVAFPLPGSSGTLDMMVRSAKAKVPTFCIVAESHV